MKFPKGARITAAAALADIIERALVGYDHSWKRLTCFATAALSTSSSSSTQSRQSLTAAMKTNIGQFADRLTSFADDLVVQPKKTSRPPPCATDFRKMVNSKLLVGDVLAAVRIIASEDSVITPTSEVVTALRLKHPPSPLDLRPPPTEPVTKTSSVSEEEVMVALKSFRPSSAGGVDGLRPGYLKDLVAPQTAEAGRRLMKDHANLCSKLLLGQIPQHARGLLFAANLTALLKKDGGIRPIAVGNVFRRLASKIAAKRVIPELRRQLSPVQLGVGVNGGCEAAAYAVRVFVQSSVVPENNVLIKLDMKNAFNTVRRDHFLEVCSSRAPSILHLASTAYATSSHLVIGNETILPETGVQQGDPLGPVLGGRRNSQKRYKIACLCYHCHSSTAPSYVTDMLHKKPLHTRCSSYTMHLLNRPAHSKATLGDRSFSLASSSVWNSIPNDVRCAPSLSSFKSSLKTYLFRSVYID